MLANYTCEKDFSKISQNLKKINRLIGRDRDKLLFQGIEKSVIECFERNFLLLIGLKDDKYYKKKLIVKLNNKNNHKKKLLSFHEKFVNNALKDSNCEIQSDVSMFSDKELMRASCCLLQLQKDVLDKEQYLKFEDEIVLFEEALYEFNQITLLRIEKSLERNDLIENLVKCSYEICKYGKLVWEPINHMNYKEFSLYNEEKKETVASLYKD